MGLSDLMRLEVLGRKQADSQSRLDAARSIQNHGLVTLFERDIAENDKASPQVLADITKELDVARSAKPHPSHPPVQSFQPETTNGEQQGAEHGEPITAADLVSPEPSSCVGTREGVAVVWDQVTVADIERAKRGLATRRSEILARHSDELKALEAEQVEQAIGAFASKFKIGGAEILTLERTAQTQAG
jgi:hypothetical protein